MLIVILLLIIIYDNQSGTILPMQVCRNGDSHVTKSVRKPPSLKWEFPVKLPQCWGALPARIFFSPCRDTCVVCRWRRVFAASERGIIDGGTLPGQHRATAADRQRHVAGQSGSCTPPHHAGCLIDTNPAGVES